MIVLLLFKEVALSLQYKIKPGTKFQTWYIKICVYINFFKQLKIIKP